MNDMNEGDRDNRDYVPRSQIRRAADRDRDLAHSTLEIKDVFMICGVIITAAGALFTAWISLTSSDANLNTKLITLESNTLHSFETDSARIKDIRVDLGQIKTKVDDLENTTQQIYIKLQEHNAGGKLKH